VHLFSLKKLHNVLFFTIFSSFFRFPAAALPAPDAASAFFSSASMPGLRSLPCHLSSDSLAERRRFSSSAHAGSSGSSLICTCKHTSSSSQCVSKVCKL